MSVEPGSGGQDYIDGSTNRIKEIHNRLKELGLREKVLIEVDGGIKLTNAKEVVDAGADILVAGSAIFCTESPTESIKKFKLIAMA